MAANVPGMTIADFIAACSNSIIGIPAKTIQTSFANGSYVCKI